MFATETWEKREGTQTLVSGGDRCRQCDVWVSGGCDAVTCHAAVTELVTWLQTPDRDLHHTAVTRPSLQRGQIIRKWHAAMVGGGNDMTWRMAIISLLTTMLSKQTTFYIYVCLCLYFLPRLFLAQGDTEPFLVWSMSVLCHQHTCCSAADTRTSHDRLQMRIKKR